ncbi:TadE/TadG family type IV pilus assembly protein [Streptomyces sp. SYP-A7185]|uniref:TadE/TadG family type IV pilus assembly protein n=1 Tax=Streptomyces sp. SYP-A7185 TaxID=3040076 RepID=UPI0038F6F5DD
MSGNKIPVPRPGGTPRGAAAARAALARAGRARGGQERGSSTLEAVLCLTVLVPILGIIAAFGLAGLGDSTAANAANAAARAASTSADPDTAAARGRQAALTSLDQAQRTCASSDIVVDTSGFPSRPGQPGTITVRVDCTIPLAKLAAPGLPGSTTLTATRHSAVDRYVARTGEGGGP